MATAASKLKEKLEREETQHSDHALRSAIEDIANLPAKEIPKFQKLRNVRDLILTAFLETGDFFHTAENQSYYFARAEKKAYPVTQEDAFGTLLKARTGLSRIEDYYKFAVDTIDNWALTSTPTAEVHVLGHYDRANQLHYVSNGAAGLLVRERGGQWTEGHNGQDSVYFYTEPLAEPFAPELGKTLGSLDWFWSKFLFASTEGGLSPSETRVLMNTWLLQQLFPEFRRTRIIPAFLGPMGAGKTTAVKLIGELLIGSKFQPVTVKEKQEDFTVAITRRVFAGFDNVDTRVKWLEDALATYATGMEVQMRKLYRTNEEASFPVRAVVAITSRDPKFKRPDVAQRLLVATYAAPEDVIDEETLFEEVRQKRSATWGDLLMLAATYADRLDLEKKYKVRFRMADYGTFYLKGAATDEDCDVWQELLTKLSEAQAEFSTTGDVVADALAELLERELGDRVEYRSGELYKELKQIHDETSTAWFPKSASSFGNILKNSQPLLELTLGITIDISERQHQGKRVVTITRKTARGREPGDESEAGDEKGI